MVKGLPWGTIITALSIVFKDFEELMYSLNLSLAGVIETIEKFVEFVTGAP